MFHSEQTKWVEEFDRRCKADANLAMQLERVAEAIRRENWAFYRGVACGFGASFILILAYILVTGQ